jgi:hypothetical protein
MLYAPLTPKAIFIVLIFGVFLLIDRGCSVDQSVIDAQSRHQAAMKDLGKNDYVPVRRPW